MTHGYRNCFPKRINLSDKQAHYIHNRVTTLALGLLPEANTTCRGGLYRSASGVTFNTKCDSRGDGPNLSSTHTDRLEDCLEACVAYVPEVGNGKCANMAYEPNSKAGYLNCHLKS